MILVYYVLFLPRLFFGVCAGFFFYYSYIITKDNSVRPKSNPIFDDTIKKKKF